MKTEWMTISPALAAEWLKTANTRNRCISPRKVSQYAADMRAGHWKANHQGIAFYEDGTISDGQHRLAACVSSGINLDVFVTFGVPTDAGAGIDAHRPRTTVDQVRIAGLSDWIGREELAIAKAINAMASGETLSSHSAVEFLDRNRASVECATGAMRKKSRFVTTAPVFAAMACAAPIVGQSVIDGFGRILQSGIQTDMDDLAVIRLRERLMMSGSEFQKGQVQRNDCIKITMRAIKAFNDREQLRKLFAPTDFIYPPLK